MWRAAGSGHFDLAVKLVKKKFESVARAFTSATLRV
jgi:hypothetical protein